MITCTLHSMNHYKNITFYKPLHVDYMQWRSQSNVSFLFTTLEIKALLITSKHFNGENNVIPILLTLFFPKFSFLTFGAFWGKSLMASSDINLLSLISSSSNCSNKTFTVYISSHCKFWLMIETISEIPDKSRTDSHLGNILLYDLDHISHYTSAT